MNKLKENDTIDLVLSYVDSSSGEEVSFIGIGSIHNNSFIKPTDPKHQIRLTFNFPELNMSGVTFRIQPQYGQIFITGNQLIDSNLNPVETIYIRMDLKESQVTVYEPIDIGFIDSSIARVSDIPTTTSKLTNDSGFITSDALTGYATEN